MTTLLWGCAEEEPAEEQARVQAPEFSLPVLGQEASVALADLRGKIVVLDFWATWCLPCELQVPSLNAFWDAHREDPNLRLYGISVDIEGPEVVAQWVAEKGVRYPILLATDELALSFGARGFPTLYVIGPDGKIDSSHAGLIEMDFLEDALRGLRDR